MRVPRLRIGCGYGCREGAGWVAHVPCKCGDPTPPHVRRRRLRRLRRCCSHAARMRPACVALARRHDPLAAGLLAPLARRSGAARTQLFGGAKQLRSMTAGNMRHFWIAYEAYLRIVQHKADLIARHGFDGIWMAFNTKSV